MSTITFTTKKVEPKKGMGFVLMSMDPVFIKIEKVNFPTNQGDKEVEEILFYPNSTIKQDNIRNKLEIQGMKVPKLTFKIEIEGSKIKFEESPKGGSFTTSGSSSGSAGIKKEPSGNFLKGKRLELRDYSLDKITKSDEEEPDIDTSCLTFTCPQCNTETPTSDAVEHNGNKYCSVACRDKAQQKPPQKECPWCHNNFSNLPISGSQGKSYCSDECKQNAEKDKDNPKQEEPEKKYNPQEDIDKAERRRQAEVIKNKTELDNLIQKGKGQDNPTDLKDTLEQIEQKNSTQAYQELKSEIDDLKNKLNGKLTLSEVQQRETTKLSSLLTENNLKKEDLDTET
ncbi:MAG: hypothetical protein I3273_05760 [Candidatus Moeniiplasma glomeromycotorum]|nr:hypothetical protein [Candidatus Moeniiplasma glomeromycotorum]MCE8169591.1 hypothetical protein [Candidatus Moeniiplasma glomeromycotorum]